jgi:opacity protein-like surface antigen
MVGAMARSALLKSLSGVSAFCVLFVLAEPGFANDAEILRKLEKLSQRVEELEREVAVSRREATRARSELARIRPARTPSASGPISVQTPAGEPISLVSKPPEPKGWGGVHIGLGGGMVAGHSRYSAADYGVSSSSSTNRSPNFVSNSTSASIIEGIGRGEARKRLGGLASLTAGYDYQFHPRLLAGIQLEGSVPFLSMDQDAYNVTRSSTVGVTTSTAFLNPFPPLTSTQVTSQSGVSASAYRIKFEPTWMASGLLRFGVLLTPDTLAYVAAGGGYSKFNTDIVSKNLGIPTFVLGGGLEQRIGGNWTISADYRFHHLVQTTVRERADGASLNNNAGSTSTGSTTAMSVNRFDGSIHAFRLGLNYRFQ